MKNLAFLLVGTFFVLLTSCTSSTDSVKFAKEQSDSLNSGTSGDSTDFLIGMADARRMDYKEGLLATERGTLPEIRSYGKLMMKDQEELLAEIKAIGRTENIVIPERISDSKTDGFKDLYSKHGKKFDEKFISMITIDHERDVKEFKKAAESTEASSYGANVRDFARKRLPTIKNHLEKINEIRKHQQ